MAVEQKPFQTEVSELLDIMINSLYSNKDIFLRELISNASDAIDKAKYEGLTNEKIFEGGTDWAIRLSFDVGKKTLTVSDNGIGLTKEEATNLLGTIANSGTKEFMKNLASQGKTEAASLIGQFGVGFYSSFMVAEKVTVISRKRGVPKEESVKWESAGKDSFTVDLSLKEEVGTDIVLTIKEGETSFLNEWGIKRVVTTYSDYIEHPIKMKVSVPKKDEEGKNTGEYEEKEEVLNSMKALWLRDKTEVVPVELEQFYKHLSHDYLPPVKSVQFKAEGTLEFYALLFIPQAAPVDLFHKDAKYGPMLYVKRVQIIEHCEDLLPVYLRFVTGVVESSDLPLNISREILQKNQKIAQMQKNIARKILDNLAELKRDDPENYQKFWGEFGKVLKEGIYMDSERRETIAALALFESTDTAQGLYTNLDGYLSRMKTEQEEIYFITGASRKELEHSPYLEGLEEKGYEVLFMTDDFDDIVFSALGKYKDKPLKNVLKGDLKIDSAVENSVKEEFKPLLDRAKKVLGDKILEVRLTTRLKNSPLCLVAADGAPDPNMERILKAMGQPIPTVKRHLELNPSNGIVKDLNSLSRLTSAESETKTAERIELLYSLGVLLEGGKLDNPADFMERVGRLIAPAGEVDFYL